MKSEDYKEIQFRDSRFKNLMGTLGRLFIGQHFSEKETLEIKSIINPCFIVHAKPTLDKEKVREVIEQVASHGEGCRCPVVMNKFARDKIFKELEL